ncbi:Conserved_hypothetical protein [Hexamita inflata]|uniref:Uncharacterized protein n=1 Tax=Hexamita inflata TaxID=28002 RepID=A0ABP1IKZ0_9EUKA
MKSKIIRKLKIVVDTCEIRQQPIEINNDHINNIKEVVKVSKENRIQIINKKYFSTRYIQINIDKQIQATLNQQMIHSSIMIQMKNMIRVDAQLQQKTNTCRSNQEKQQQFKINQIRNSVAQKYKYQLQTKQFSVKASINKTKVPQITKICKYHIQAALDDLKLVLYREFENTKKSFCNIEKTLNTCNRIIYTDKHIQCLNTQFQQTFINFDQSENFTVNQNLNQSIATENGSNKVFKATQKQINFMLSIVVQELEILRIQPIIETKTVKNPKPEADRRDNFQSSNSVLDCKLQVNLIVAPVEYKFFSATEQYIPRICEFSQQQLLITQKMQADQATTKIFRMQEHEKSAKTLQLSAEKQSFAFQLTLKQHIQQKYKQSIGQYQFDNEKFNQQVNIQLSQVQSIPIINQFAIEYVNPQIENSSEATTLRLKFENEILDATNVLMRSDVQNANFVQLIKINELIINLVEQIEKRTQITENDEQKVEPALLTWATFPQPEQHMTVNVSSEILDAVQKQEKEQFQKQVEFRNKQLMFSNNQMFEMKNSQMQANAASVVKEVQLQNQLDKNQQELEAATEKIFKTIKAKNHSGITLSELFQQFTEEQIELPTDMELESLQMYVASKGQQNVEVLEKVYSNQDDLCGDDLDLIKQLTQFEQQIVEVIINAQSAEIFLYFIQKIEKFREDVLLNLIDLNTVMMNLESLINTCLARSTDLQNELIETFNNFQSMGTPECLKACDQIQQYIKDEEDFCQLVQETTETLKLLKVCKQYMARSKYTFDV